MLHGKQFFSSLKSLILSFGQFSNTFCFKSKFVMLRCASQLVDWFTSFNLNNTFLCEKMNEKNTSRKKAAKKKWHALLHSSIVMQDSGPMRFCCGRGYPAQWQHYVPGRIFPSLCGKCSEFGSTCFYSQSAPVSCQVTSRQSWSRQRPRRRLRPPSLDRPHLRPAACCPIAQAVGLEAPPPEHFLWKDLQIRHLFIKGFIHSLIF